MNIEKNLQGTTLTMSLEGRLDTTTAPDLDKEVQASTQGVDMLIFDFLKLEYISSAGLRALLVAQKIMNKQGKMVIKNVNETIAEVFEITGFNEVLTIE